jgi:calcineurin-like phosphoesterase family protein
MIYFTADLHFRHFNIIRHCNRPFATVEEMDETLTRNWNATVKPEDEVYVLGDLTMAPAPEAHRILTSLNGTKYFLRGNHDRFLKQFTPYEKDFVWIKDYFLLRHDGRAYVLCHYPFAEWDGFHRGAIHLYGHIHTNRESAARLDTNALSFNVGVDCTDFRPVSIEEINAMAEKRIARRNSAEVY